PVVSASSPRFTAINIPSRNDEDRSNAHSAASSDSTTYPLPRIAGGSRRLNDPPATSATRAVSGSVSQRPASGEYASPSSSDFDAPRVAPTINAAMYRHASTASRAACVVRELSPAYRTASAGSDAKNSGTGASRMIEPLPAVFGSSEPAYGSPLCSKRCSAARVALPMSKQVPVLLR